MTESQTEQLNRLKAYLKERLEEFHISSAVSLIEYKDSAVAWSEDGNVLTHSTKKINEAIAQARTLAPILIANTLREIEWLEQRVFIEMWPTPPRHAVEQSEECHSRLNDILEDFKEVLP